MNHTKVNSDQHLDKLVFIELLKQKSQEGHDVLSQYIRAFAIYVAILGGLLKFALDKNATPELKQALLSAGILLSLVGLACCVFGEKLRRSISAEVRNLNEKLGSPLVASEMKHLHYTVIIALSFVVLALIALFYLLIS